MIPIYMLGMYIYKWSLHNVRNEISKTNIAQVSFYLESLEMEIDRIKILQYDCLNDENLNKLSARYGIMGQYEINESLRQLHRRLVTIKNSSNYIKNVNVYIRNVKKTISSNNGINDFDYEMYENIRSAAGIKGAQIIKYKDGLYLSTYQQNNYLMNSPDYIISIELNRQAFIQALSKFNMYDEIGSVLIDKSDSTVIINQAEEDLLLKKEIINGIFSSGTKGMKLYNIDDKSYYILYVKSEYLNMIYLKCIPEEVVEKPFNSFYIWAWAFTIAVCCIILIYSISTYKLIHKPLIKLVKSFHKVENGDLKVNIQHDQNDEFGYLYKCFNKMMENLNTLIDQVYNQRILMQRAELKQLQAQINPHFLYNSFFAINTMAKTGDENLAIFTKRLGEYFQFITRNSSDKIPLSDEVKHAKVYTEIQLMRFSRALEIKFGEYPEKYSELKVPRIILQPIIENAFNHGLNKLENSRIIVIDFLENDNGLDIIVEDNGCGMTDYDIAELQNALLYTGNDIETTGIINIHRRIRLEYGQNSGVMVSKSELGGLKVILRIEIPYGYELDNYYQNQ
ncbi:histidine kinase [Ruminiclostridium herbifermentans]|uniref:Histidine kinase n=2 Tax=Ruminiclostridium herbifermentans TaxID=2488810 RepID=A0A4U7JK54_9FIRM|nr:histidine kinase [Ruminiclostridium herbifermentans]